jgi:hypothetical protein
MDQIKTLFGQRKQLPKPKRSTERGDLLDTILGRLNPSRVKAGYKPLTYGGLAYKLTGVPTKDLYALISKMSDAEHRGVSPGMVFWSEIRPKPKEV